MAYALYSETLWSSLAEALDEATGAGADGSGLVQLADGYLSLADVGTYFAVNCLDFAWPEADDLLAAGKAAAAESPYFGEALVNDYVRCSLWPAEPDPVRPPTATGVAPIVVVSTTGDPATPYENGVTVAGLLPGAALITNVGEGHGVAFTGGVDCVDDALEEYLVDLVVPPDGLRCED